MDCVFGKLAFEADQFSKEFKKEALALGEQEGLEKGAVADKNTAWTRIVKQALENVLTSPKPQYGYRAEYSNKVKRTTEYMVDFLAWDDREGSGQRAVVAVESEWGNPRMFNAGGATAIAEAVVQDFWKLLAFKSPLKVLVYTAFDGPMRNAIHDKLRKTLLSFSQHVIGECYLFIEFSNDSCYRYKFEVKSNERVTDAQFEPLDAESKKILAQC